MADEELLPFPSPSALLGRQSPDHQAADSLLAAATRGKKDKAHARRPSNEKKKAALPRKAPAVEAKEASVIKPKQTKSRNGCHTCKAKRLKCGEEKPGCQNCSKRNVVCGGYKKVFQWRDFNEQNVRTTVERPQLRQSNSNRSPVRLVSADSSQVVTPISEIPPKVVAGATKVPMQRASTPPNVQTAQQVRPQMQRARSTSPQEKLEPSPHDSALSSATQEYLGTAPHSREEDRPNITDEFASVSFSPQHMFALRSRSLSPSMAGRAPTFTEFLVPHISIEHDVQQDFVPFSMPEDMQLPMWSTYLDTAGMNGPEFIGGDIHVDQLQDERQNDAIFSWPSHFNTPTSPKERDESRNSIAFWNDAMSGVYSQPEIPLNSPEHLGLRFLQVTAGNLSIMDGPSENPWRTIVWPMAQHSAALYHAVLAMTAFNLAWDQPQLRTIGQEHKNISIQNIKEGIRDGTMTDHTALATALALGFSEAWDRPTTTGNVHIKGAQCLVKRCLEAHTIQPLVGIELKRLKFLCNAWVYMDVISRLTSVDSDEGTDFDSTKILEPDSPRISSVSRLGSARQRGFGIDFGMPIDARLDPLMGCAGTLFPIIGRVANLVRKVCRSNHNSPGIVSHGRDLKRMLEDWDPPEEVESPEDPTTGVENARQTAEAYRWATLLHLHQAVPELPSLSSVELAQRAMASVATVPLESRTTIVQIYPLMVAGCEQKDDEDRDWVRERWQAMSERMRIGIVDKCLAVTEEVWGRRDAYEAKPIAQRKLVRTAELKEAKMNSSPRHRRPTDVFDARPGRGGMVFSYVETDSEPIAHQLKDVNGPDTIRRRKGAADRVTVDPAYSVRGPIHWVGVMWEWSWEVLLG